VAGVLVVAGVGFRIHLRAVRGMIRVIKVPSLYARGWGRHGFRVGMAHAVIGVATA
jgi:hypothetical protein